MSETIQKYKQARNAIERMDAIEQLIPKLIEATNRSLGQLNDQLAGAVEIVDAVVQILGEEAVSRAVSETRLVRAKETAKNQEAAIAKGVEAGQLKKTETVTPTSYIVFKEYDKEGTELAVSRFQSSLKNLQPKVREELAGKTVGYKVKVEGEHSFEVMEIYEVVPTSELPVKQPTTPVPAPATETQAAP